jgi:hypothetical protein
VCVCVCILCLLSKMPFTMCFFFFFFFFFLTGTTATRMTNIRDHHARVRECLPTARAKATFACAAPSSTRRQSCAIKSSSPQVLKSSSPQVLKSSSHQVIKSSSHQVIKSSSHQVPKPPVHVPTATPRPLARRHKRHAANGRKHAQDAGVRVPVQAQRKRGGAEVNGKLGRRLQEYIYT